MEKLFGEVPLFVFVFVDNWTKYGHRRLNVGTVVSFNVMKHDVDR